MCGQYCILAPQIMEEKSSDELKVSKDLFCLFSRV